MSEPAVGGRYMRLFGRRTGIIKGISHLSPDRGDPPVYVSTPDLTDVSDLCGADRDVDVSGVSGKGFTLERSLLTCIGETVERYCYYYPEPASELESGSHAEVSDRRETVPYEYLKAFNVGPGTGDLTEQTSLHWATGRSLFDGEPVLVPDSLVWFHPDRTERYLVSTSNGCAAARTARTAIVRSIFEAVERDALLRSWCRQSSPARLTDVPDEAAPYVSEFTERGHEVEFYALASTVDVPVVGCLVRKGDGSLPNCVFACSADLTVADAMTSALTEAGQGWAMAATALWDYDVTAINERERFEEFKESFLYYSCGEGTEHLLAFLDGGGATATDRLNEVETLEGLVGRLDDAGCRPVLFDLTTKDVRDAGLTVIRVVIPELLPLTPPSDLPTEHPDLADVEVTELAHPLG